MHAPSRLLLNLASGHITSSLASYCQSPVLLLHPGQYRHRLSGLVPDLLCNSPPLCISPASVGASCLLGCSISTVLPAVLFILFPPFLFSLILSFSRRRRALWCCCCRRFVCFTLSLFRHSVTHSIFDFSHSFIQSLFIHSLILFTLDFSHSLCFTLYTLLLVTLNASCSCPLTCLINHHSFIPHTSHTTYHCIPLLHPSIATLVPPFHSSSSPRPETRPLLQHPLCCASALQSPRLLCAFDSILGLGTRSAVLYQS